LKVGGQPYRTIWVAPDGVSVDIIDQTKLPHELVVERLATLDDAARAIADMLVRGAPLIGVTAAYGLCLALRRDASDESMSRASAVLLATRPTAVNLRAALEHMQAHLERVAPAERAAAAYALAAEMADLDVKQNLAIGQHGLALLREKARPGKPVRVMTHCNAGWLATVDGGTALAPIYAAHDAGIEVEVWVSETRPRNQGASLTAWELGQHGVPYAAIVDNAAGHLMQRGEVDLVIVGTDRTTRSGDVANKIGTYLKAVAARDCGVPFYVAAPSSSIDWSLEAGSEIPIEERGPREVTHVIGRGGGGASEAVEVLPKGASVRNFGFDVTPARLVTGLITERGVCAATRPSLEQLFPERRAPSLG
jgi:methylthioribose-1-phosphate isomerase